MEKRNTLLQLGFLIVVLLALGLAFLRVSNTEIDASGPVRSAQSRSGHYVPPETARRTLESLKQEELLGVAPAGTGAYASRPGHTYGEKNNPLIAGAVAPSAGGAGGRANSARRSYGNGQPSSGHVFPASDRYAGREETHYSASSYRDSRERGNIYSSVPGTNRAPGGRTSAPIAGVGRPTEKEQMNGIFAPYLNSLTKEQAESLNRQLTGLSSRVERAVLQAFLPKSRKDANIEKYLQRNSSYSASSSPFASVENQMAAQKAGIMNSMNGAFGKEAADEAGKVMDAYQKELLGALSQKGLTQEQAAQKTREISQKYEKELQNVGQKHALKDFEAKQMEKDNFLQEGLASAYGADFAAQAGDILASWREKDMQLALSGLPAEEYYKQQFENQRARRKELDKLCQQYGYSPDAFRKVENEWENKRVNQALKDEREGKTLPTKHHFDESYISSTAADLGKEHNDKEQTARNLYGEEGAKAVNDIYNRYEARMSKILNSDKPLSDKLEEMKNARQEANAEIAALQKTPEMMNARVDTTMEQLMQDPGLANATPEQREAFERLARPVLQDMFQRINEVSESNLPEDEKKRRIAALRDRAQRQLSGGR